MIIDQTNPINPMEEFSQTLYQQLWANNDGGAAALAYAAKFGAIVGQYEQGTQEAQVKEISIKKPVTILLDAKRIKSGVYTLDAMEIQSVIDQNETQKKKEVQAKARNEVVATKSTEEEIVPTADELKDYLKQNNVKFHHMSKYETLYKLYQEHKGA